MGLKIETTGIEQYGAAGEGRVKALIIGGPGVGKTRWSSYFPKPIYLDCEGGLASVADRRVQFVTIKNSNDMLEALNFLKVESRQPSNTRDFNTVVVDTLDAFQRKVKDEWLQAHPNESAFRGFEAWGYLETKMQMLLTRLLNLDMNVIVAVHYTEKTISEGVGDNKTERQEFQLQLSGAVKDQVFNDFDLVGWMGTYFELDKETGARAQKRGLTFKPTPDKPFLKDRLHVTPEWMQVKFSDDDYADLFAAVISRIDDLPESAIFGEIPDSQGDPFAPAAGVLAPLPGGALPPQDPREVPLEQFDKPTLMKMARDAGLDVKGNTLKGELVQMLREHRAKEDAAPAAQAPAETPAEAPTPAAAPVQEAPAPAAGESAPTEAPAATPVATEAPPASPPTTEPEAGAVPTSPTPGVSDASPASDLPAQALAAARAAAGATSAPSASAEPAPTAVSSGDEAQATPQASAPSTPVAESAPAPSTAVDTEAGAVNPATGEIIAPPPTPEQALETVTAALGGEVISQTQAVEAVQESAPAPAPAPPAAPAASGACPNGEDGCGGVCREDDKRTNTGVVDKDGNPLTFVCSEPIGPNPDFIKLGYIKYRKHLCNTHYLARKAAS